MELVSMQCPQCLGNVVPFGDGSKGRCECCDSVFSLGGVQTTIDEDVEGGETRGELDLEEFFEAFARKIGPKESYEFFVGNGLKTGKGKTKIDGSRKYFGVEDDEDVYLVLDTTIFGSCKVGFACCTSGIYMKDEDGDQCFFNWEDFSECELEREGGNLRIGGCPFITQSAEAELLYDLFDELQEAL